MIPIRARAAEVHIWRAAGMSNAAIAGHLGVSGERVRQVFGRVATARPRHPPDVIVAARSLWDEGHAASEIARFMAVRCPEIAKTITKNAVVGIADRNDFPARPSPIRRTPSDPRP